MKGKLYKKSSVLCLSCFAVFATAQVGAAPEQQSAVSQPIAETSSLISANSLIGIEIQDTQNEPLASVLDIILDPTQDRAAYAIVSYGGFLGLGDKHFIVPWDAFKSNGEYLTLDVDREALDEAPGYPAGENPNMDDPEFHHSVHTFYGISPYTLDPTRDHSEENVVPKADEEAREYYDADEASSAKEESTVESPVYDWQHWAHRGGDVDWTRHMSELVGVNIETPAGDTLGELEDVMIQPSDAQLTLAFVSYGGTLGLMAETAAVPWNALTLDRAEERYTLNATPEQLAANKIDPEHFGELGDEAMMARFAAPFDKPMPGETDAPKGEMPEKSVRGVVSSVEPYSAAEAATPAGKSGVAVAVETADGQIETVHVARETVASEARFDIANGDAVTFKGFSTPFKNKTVIQATEVMVDGKTFTLDLLNSEWKQAK